MHRLQQNAGNQGRIPQAFHSPAEQWQKKQVFLSRDAHPTVPHLIVALVSALTGWTITLLGTLIFVSN
jgi:hypothetical protein